MKRLSRVSVPALIVALLGLGASMGFACTGITLKPQDGAIVFARTLEFAMDMKSNCIVIPRGKQYVGTTSTGAPGKKWTTKYGVVGVNAFAMPVTMDGMNEQGLQVGLFYFPGYAGYQTVTPENVDRSIAPWEFGVYLLSTCANVDEAVIAAKDVVVGDVVQKEMGIVPPAHFIVTDASGKCVVLEHIAGELKIHENPLGVMANSPSFDWHLTNLSNYVNLTINNVPQVNLHGDAIKSFGQGSGMRGLPGDFTPPSRFVRAVAFAHSALPVATADEGVLQAFHILNQFDIPKGAVRGVEGGQTVAEYTLWTAAADLKNRRYYFRTFDNSRIRMVDLTKVNFDVPEIRTISMQGAEQVEDVSAPVK